MGAPVMAVRVVATVAELKKALAEGKAEIVTTTAAMSKMAATYQGDKLVQQAHNVTAALHQVGVEALTTQEAARSLATLEKAMEKLENTSRPIPPAMAATAESLRKIVDEANKPQQTGLAAWFSDLQGQVTATAAGMISAQAVLSLASTAWNTFTGFIASSVQSAAGAEAAQAKLTAALRQQGTATPEVIAQYTALSSTMQKTTVYSDDLTTQMQALLVQVGHIMPSQMAAAQAASADLASGLGIDLEQATTIVAKAAAGHTEALGRYGITVDDADLKSRGFTVVLEALNAQFGGQAAAQAATYTGSVQQLANAWDNLQEAVGRRITEDPVVQAGLRALTDAVSQQADAIDANAASTGHWYDQLTHVANLIPGVYAVTQQYEVAQQALGQQAQFDAAQHDAVAAALRGQVEAWKPLLRAANDGIATNDKWRQGLVEAQKAEDAETESKRKAKAEQERLNAELQKYQENLRYVLTQAQGYQTVIDTIDGNVVEAVKAYREQGVEMSRLAAMYGLTANQSAALTEAEAAEKESLKTLIAGNHALVGVLKTRNRESREALEVSTRQLPNITAQAIASLNTAKPLGLGQLLSRDLTSFFSGGGFSRLIVQGLAGGGGLSGGLQAVGSELGGQFTSRIGQSITKALPGALGSTLGGLVGPLGALVGPFLAKVFSIGGPSQAELAGRDAAKKFEQGIAAGLSESQRQEAGGRAWAGPIIAMRDALVALGRDGGAAAAEAEAAVARLYAAERQGPEAVAAVQASIQGVLDQAARVRQAASQFGPSHAELQQMARDAKATYDYMLRSGEYTAEQLAAAFKASQEAQAKSLGINTEAQKANLDMLQQGLSTLTTQRDQLWNQIAAEAPEEVMGVVEAGQRAQLATLDKQIEDQKVKMAAQAEEAAAQLESALAGIEPDAVHVPVVFDYTNPPLGMNPGPLEVQPMADGGFGTVDKPTLFLAGEAGKEQVAFSGANKTFSQTSFGSGSVDTTALERHMASVDRRLARMPEMLSLAMQSGLRRARVRR